MSSTFGIIKSLTFYSPCVQSHASISICMHVKNPKPLFGNENAAHADRNKVALLLRPLCLSHVRQLELPPRERKVNTKIYLKVSPVSITQHTYVMCSLHVLGWFVPEFCHCWTLFFMHF